MICTSEKILENIQVENGIYKLVIEGKYKAKPGQFFMLKAWEHEPLLPRPISVYDVTDTSIVFLYRVSGRGTELLSKQRKGEFIQIMGPLGTGYFIDSDKKNIAIICGGIGVAPLNYLAKEINSKKENDTTIDFYVGFKDKEFGISGIRNYVDNLNITLETSANKEQKYITDIFNPSKYDVVYCCGPEIMMKKVVDKCKPYNIPLQISMEKRMACGIGACLGCTCNTKDGFRRTCADGPVFNGYEVIL